MLGNEHAARHGRREPLVCVDGYGICPLDTRQQGTASIGRYCAKAALARRGGDGEDLLTVLGNAQINSRPLTESELAYNGLLYVAAGLETTRNAISAGLLALLEHPSQLELLLRDAALMPTAVQPPVIDRETRYAAGDSPDGGFQ